MFVCITDSDAELTLIVDNAHAEAKGCEYDSCVDKTCAIAIEKILKYSSPQQLVDFANAIKSQYEELMWHYNGARVVEALARAISTHLMTSGHRVVGMIKSLEEVLLQLAKVCFKWQLGVYNIVKVANENIGGMILDANANHIIRTLLFAVSAEEPPPTKAPKHSVSTSSVVC